VFDGYLFIPYKTVSFTVLPNMLNEYSVFWDVMVCRLLKSKDLQNEYLPVDMV